MSESERWQQIKDVLHQALEREGNDRAMFLDQACSGDEALRAEVEGLIASHGQAQTFFEKPAIEDAARMFGSAHPESRVGQSIGHYRIISLLGAGGMGEVYLAEDPRLGRQVALKLLRSDFTRDSNRVRRLRQEARSASALNHPNIITIHEIGEHSDQLFIVTEVIDGKTLRELMQRAGMPIREALDIATQVASAMAEAHRAGIIHRDIKPENIMVRGSGLVKVLDFGLAKLTEKPVTQGTSAELSSFIHTDPQVVMGTVNYMSPEQTRGLALDRRADIFSLGVVLYEMIAGRKPFERATAADTLIAVLQEEPLSLAQQRPEAPAELERIVRRALAKDRESRYQTAEEVLQDLRNLNEEIKFAAKLEQSARSNSGGDGTVSGSRQTAVGRLGGPSPHPISSAEYIATEIKRNKRGIAILILAMLIIGVALFAYSRFRDNHKTINSLAVLPFVNESADPNAEYLSDGITESLINNLSRLPNIKIMSRSSVFRYNGKETDVQRIGRELGVEAVLTGRVMQRGDELSISIELVDARDSSHIWGQKYNRKLSDILAVQEAISREVSGKLRVQLTGEEQKRLSRAATENPEAYQLYLKGRYYLGKRTDEGLKKAIEYFNQTIEKDPAYALAYSGLADSHIYLMRLGLLHDSPREAYLRARSSVTKALEIDDNLAEAHTSLALIKMDYEWDWPGSEREFRRALELNPNEAEAHHQYSHYLTAEGRTPESLVESLRALELDPLSLPLNAHLAWHYLYARQYDQAIERCRKTIEMDANFPQSYDFLGGAYELKGMYEEAIAGFQKAISLSGDSVRIRAELGHAYAVAGKKKEALKLIAELNELSKETYISPYDIATIYVGLGQKEQAFDWLQKAYAERSDWLRYLKVDPRLDPLRSEPRFAELVRGVGLPQ